jgi:hypothetical protein
MTSWWHRPGDRHASTARAGLVLAALLCAAGQTHAQTPSEKLTTVLADLARAVPQQEGAAAAGRSLQTALPPLEIDGLPRSVRDAVHGRRLRINAQNEVQVYILLQSISEDVLQQLSAAGVTVEIADAARNRVQARVPAARLQAIAALPFVSFIRLPTYARHTIGRVTTEGDAILTSDAVRDQFQLDGTGVSVGAISDGLKGVFATGCQSCGSAPGGPMSTGDLPSATGTRNAQGVLTASAGGISGRSFQADGDLEGLPPTSPPCSFQGAGAEGTALLEIIHDLAPGAQLSFANADTDLAFSLAVNSLASGNDIVVDDVTFFGEPSDGTSSVSSNTAAALNNPANRIRAYFTSAGNSADNHYYGAFADSGIDGSTIGGISNTGRLHQFQQTGETIDVLGLGPRPYNVIALPRNGEVIVVLTWDDRFGSSGNNYDLFLVQQSTGRTVASSTDVQRGGSDPLEAVDYVNTGAQDTFRIVIQNVGNRAEVRRLNLYAFAPECAAAGPILLAPNHHERMNYNTAVMSVTAQSDAGGSPVSVTSVGAICSASAAAAGVFSGSPAPDESCLDTNHGTIEFFSSRGPTLDGRIKPDITAIDGVSISGAGGFPTPFFGTSAAAPHAAGIAALVLQAAPCLITGSGGAVEPSTARARVRTLMLGTAVRLSGSAPDNTFGFGRADALAAVQGSLPVLDGPSTIVASGNTPTGASLRPEALGFSDPQRCPLTRLSWSGGCGTSPGATLDCSFGTTSVTVSASSNGVAFSSPADLRITVTDFALAVSPASVGVTAGQAAVYQVTVSSSGGPFTGPVTLSCGTVPSGANCAFNPPVITPGSSSAVSTLTISTGARTVAAGPGAVASARTFASGRGSGPHPTSDSRVIQVRRRSVWPAVTVLVLIVPGVIAVRRQGASPWAVALLASAVAAQASCRGGDSNPTPPATNPLATLSSASLTFGSQDVGTTSAPQSVSLANAGNATLTISGISASGDFAQTNTCGGSLAAGTACAIQVSFSPSGTGQRTGSLTVSDNAANSPQAVALVGTGKTPAGPAGPGTHQITVLGTSGTLVHSAGVSLVIS